MALIALSVAVGLAACSSAAESRPPGSGSPDSRSITEADAIRLALAEDAQFAGIGPRDPELIGQAAWYEVAYTEDGWQVRIVIGWGDCPAGCINEHAWLYAVNRAGEVELLGEEGDPMPGETGVRGVVVAGPTCPVETVPPEPGCEPRPVEGALLFFVDQAGTEVAQATTGADGSFSVALAPGAYRVVPQPVDGLMRTAPEQVFEVEAGKPPGELTVEYDTGLR
jgi:hypothetical protein